MQEPQKYIRLEEVLLRLEEDEGILKARIASILGLGEDDIIGYELVKHAVDSRNRRRIFFVYSADVLIESPEDFLAHKEAEPDWPEVVRRHKVRLHEPYIYKPGKVPFKRDMMRPLVVGAGPCGMFAALTLSMAGLKPIVIERGKEVDERVSDVEKFLRTRRLDPESNVQFGEGGAGTFSDGKLYTLINDPRTKFIFTELIKAGAPPQIAWSATPHIGTDKLRGVVKNLRERIIALGGEFKFDARLDDIRIENGKAEAVILESGEEISAGKVILAIGHSARDTYELLCKRGIRIEPKPFAIGLRIEHTAEIINRSQYHGFYNHPKLQAAKYKLVQHLPDARSVYTFCMCPGGYVIAAASEPGCLVVNGMSEYTRDGANSNSALLVSVLPADFGSDHPLAGVEFQRNWEKRAFEAGGSDYSAPAQLVGDFLKMEPSRKPGKIRPTYEPGVKFGVLDNCLPDYVINSLRKAIPLMDKKIKGFASYDAVLTGVETRSSAPVRLVRGENLESNIKGIYPAGEGAGYAGGIVSSAIDGLKAAESIINSN